MDQENKIRRGKDAAQILAHPIYQEAFLLLRGQMMEEFQKSLADDGELRDEIWRTMKCLDAVEAQLKHIMTNGKLESETKMVGGAPH